MVSFRHSRAACRAALRPVALVTALLAGPSSAAPPLDLAGCNGPQQVRVHDVVPPSLLSGPGFTLAPCATLRGHLYEFAIDTEYGPINAESLEMLAIRVAEMPALARAESTTRSESYRGAAAKAGKNTLKAIGNVLLHPIDSAIGLPKGVYRFVQNTAGKYHEKAREAKDKHLHGRDEDAPELTPIPGAEQVPAVDSPWYSRGAKKAEGFALSRIGYDRARRDWARELDVDPYTRNPLLNDRLDDLAWAALAGGRSFSLALAATGGVATAAGYVGKIDRLVWDASPEEIAVRNRRTLQVLGCAGIPTSHFLANGRFTATLQSSLTDALERLHPTAGCDDFLELAAAAESEVEARFLIHAIDMLEARSRKDVRPKHLVPVGGGFALRLGQGSRASLIVALPVDRLQGSESMRAFLDAPEFKLSDKLILLGGDADNGARRALTRHGFSIVENVGYPGRVALR